MLERIQNTERHIFHSFGETIDKGDYIVSRSHEYPKWYQANMVELREHSGRELEDWEAVFREHFDHATYKHLMLYIPTVGKFKALCEELDSIMTSENRGTPPLVIERITWMFASKTGDHASIPDGMEVCSVETEDDYQDLIAFSIEESRDEPWFTNDADTRAILESRRAILENVGVRWYRLCKNGDRRILARLGMFEHDGFCRLQSVGTLKSHRRRGFGSILVGFAIGEALRQGATGLALSTVTDTGANSMYMQAGFCSVGSDLWVMRYPK
jgi:GNAT superfamily N-acetyltransferase